MGTAEGQSYLENKPKEMPVILDDPKKQAVQLLPVGLGNLGNTCYLNSSLQCFKRVNELTNFLKKTDLQ